jgi:archaellum component FlaC
MPTSALEESIKSLTEKVDAGFAYAHEQFRRIDERFSKIDEQFLKIDERFIKIDEQFAKIDERFTKIECQLADLAETLDYSMVVTGEHFQKLTERIELMEGFVINHEGRIRALEG